MSLAIPLQILLVMAAAVFGVFILIKLLSLIGWLIGSIFGAIAAILGRVGSFIGGEVSDCLRLVGGVITAALFVPFTVLNIAIGRWSRANHYGRALEEEALGVGKAAYRIALGHPARLLGLSHITEGVERRLPDVMRRAPGVDRPRGRPDAFDGYTVVGALPSGGSGARLWLAEPSTEKRTTLARSGMSMPDKVVIKAFSLSDGSTLPQIVRESRALQSARKLGLVFEHELTSSRFHYVMPYVPGDDLLLVTQQLHADAPARGLDERQQRRVLGYMSDLLQVIHRFHEHGLWHKDVKPSNIIVSDGRVQLVDLGLITPLQSAMTLTTHGTEYFRDPELVRLAMKGVKVHEVDGVKFDIYGAGAVFYSLLENSFPAHGSLSQITKSCPESMRWIIRRAMADIGQRYGTAMEMLADLQAVMAAPKLAAFAPAQLPSMGGSPRPRSGFLAKLNLGRGAAALAAAEAAEAAQLAAHEAGDAMRSAVDEAERGLTGAFAQHADLHADSHPAASKHAKSRRRHGPTPATRRHGRVGWGALVAAILMLGFVGMLGVVTLFGFRQNDGPMGFESTWRSSASAPIPAPSAPARLASLPGRIVFGAKQAVRTTGDAMQSALDNIKGSVTIDTPVSPRSVHLDALAKKLAVHRSANDHERILLLDDVPHIQRDDVYAVMAPALPAFERARFEIAGFDREHGLSAEDHERLEAKARALIGLTSPGSPEAVNRLEAFLAAEPELDAVLWLARGDAKGEVMVDLIADGDQTRADGQTLLTTFLGLN